MSTLVLKSPLKNLPIPLITITICAFCFLIFSYTERISFLSFNSRPSIKHALEKSTKDVKTREDLNDGVDNGLEFDQNTFSVNENDGTWKFNSSFKPLYTESSCPYLDKQVTCATNGRTDSDYWHWEWQPDGYILPRFDPKIALEKLRGKKLMFVGDSLQRGQWQSFVCLVQSIIPEGKKSMKRALPLSVFRAEEYNATVEFFWAPFIIESNNDLKGNSSTRILRIDSVAKHAKHWLDVDILVFNTYLWWMNGKTIKSLWGSFANGEEGYEELDATVSYRIALKTWANWVDSTINTNKTRVFFTTMSPAHQWSTDWNNVGGIKCFNETKPVTKKGHWGTGSDKRMMKIVSRVLDKMKVPVTVLNITQLSEYRIDAHSSIYTETRGKLLTAEQRADPLHFADCVHWCLPGVPDTWNQIFLAQLL